MLAFLQDHGYGALVIGFTVISIVLGAVASIFQAVGKAVPGWIGTGISWVGSALHFLNGNVQGAVVKDPAGQ